jgi:hypothetical protein
MAPAAAKRTIIINRHRRAFIWLDSLPSASYSSWRVRSLTFPANAALVPAIQRAAIEYYGQSGHPSSYGLLGAEFTSHMADTLKVEILLSGEAAKPYEGQTMQLCDVRTGLSPEYADGVALGLEKEAKVNSLPAGQLVIACAAHDPVGSSPYIYEFLSKLLMKLLCSARPESSDTELKSLLGF